GAGGLEAVVVGVPPPFTLIVEDAARVEAEIAADRTHVAVSRAGYVCGGLREDGIMLRYSWKPCEFAHSHRRADLERTFIRFDRVQLGHAVHVYQDFRRDDAAADVDNEIGAAAERHAARIAGPRGDRFFDRARADHAKFGQGVHQAAPHRSSSQGAANGREPGIRNPGCEAWISGPPPRGVPG